MSTGESALPADAKGLANLFLDWAEVAGRSISPLKLQKLLYFCHADYIAHFGKPLIKQEFEAWQHGPVIPSIYQEFKDDRGEPIRKRAQVFDPVSATRKQAQCSLPDREAARVRKLYEFYSQFTATELSQLSHAQEGPWRHARGLFANGLNMDRRIARDLIHRHHKLIHD